MKQLKLNSEVAVARKENNTVAGLLSARTGLMSVITTIALCVMLGFNSNNLMAQNDMWLERDPRIPWENFPPSVGHQLCCNKPCYHRFVVTTELDENCCIVITITNPARCTGKITIKVYGQESMTMYANITEYNITIGPGQSYTTAPICIPKDKLNEDFDWKVTYFTSNPMPTTVLIGKGTVKAEDIKKCLDDIIIKDPCSFDEVWPTRSERIAIPIPGTDDYCEVLYTYEFKHHNDPNNNAFTMRSGNITDLCPELLEYIFGPNFSYPGEVAMARKIELLNIANKIMSDFYFYRLVNGGFPVEAFDFLLLFENNRVNSNFYVETSVPC